jgi:hypothetical protein
MKINLTKKQRFVLSIIILAILLFLTRSKPSDTDGSVPASAVETEIESTQ